MKPHPLRQGFRFDMQPGVGEILAQVADAEALGHPNPIIIVQTIVEPNVDGPDGSDDLGTQKHCRLADEADFSQALEAKGLRIVALENPTDGINMIPLAIDHTHIPMRLEILYDSADGPRQIRIIRVQPSRGFPPLPYETLC